MPIGRHEVGVIRFADGEVHAVRNWCPRKGALGIACVLAESTSGLFFRNCVNDGLFAMECPGLSEAFQEGDGAGGIYALMEARGMLEPPNRETA